MHFTAVLLKMFGSKVPAIKKTAVASIVLALASAPLKQMALAMASDMEQRASKGEVAAQRELAGCLTKSCPGIAADRAMACAWRIVIVAGGSESVTATDVEQRRLT